MFELSEDARSGTVSPWDGLRRAYAALTSTSTGYSTSDNSGIGCFVAKDPPDDYPVEPAEDFDHAATSRLKGSSRRRFCPGL